MLTRSVKILSKVKPNILNPLQLFFNGFLFFDISRLFDQLLVLSYLSFALGYRVESFVVRLELCQKLNVGLGNVVKITFPNEFINCGPDRQDYGCHTDAQNDP